MNETGVGPGRSPLSRTTKIHTKLGNPYLAVTLDEDDWPFEVFGWTGHSGDCRPSS